MASERVMPGHLERECPHVDPQKIEWKTEENDVGTVGGGAAPVLGPLWFAAPLGGYERAGGGIH